MQEKLSIKKVYNNAVKYTTNHLFAFAFLVFFYFLGSLLPMLIGTTSFKVLMIPYYYLFLYFAAGFYYKQQILWDRGIFCHAALRFLTAILLFLAAILISTFGINLVLNFIRVTFFGGEAVVFVILHSLTWQVLKYLFIFMLFIVFFVVPSFAFISEITGKSRSLLNAFVKVKGNFCRIALVVLSAMSFTLVTLYVFRFLPFYMTELMRDVVLVFMTILYFKIYDFFYTIPQNRRKSDNTPKSESKKTDDIKIDTNNVQETIKLAGLTDKFKHLFEQFLPNKGDDGHANQG